MEEATVHAVDSLGGSGPGWLFAIGVLVIAAAVAIRAFPVWREVKLEKLKIEREREKRKAEEVKLRDERERDNHAIAQRQIDSQDRSTVVMHAVTAQMELMRKEWDVSRRGSRQMQEQMGDIAHKVDEIHVAVVTSNR